MSGPDLAPQKILLSQHFRSEAIGRWSQIELLFAVGGLVSEIGVTKYISSNWAIYESIFNKMLIKLWDLSTHLLYVLIFTQYYAVGCFDWYYNLINQTGYDRSTDQTDKSADLSEFADYRYYRSDKPLYRIGIGSADYKGVYRLIGFLYYNNFFRHKKNLICAKLVQIPI